MATHGSWVPRVLKKRGSEFNVAPEKASSSSSAAPPPALPSAAAAGRAQAAWGGAADLDELPDEKDEQAAAKKARTDVAAAPGAAAASTLPPGVDEITAAAPRLAAHIVADGKFNKVAAMAFSLLDAGRVTQQNAAAFFCVLEAGMANPRRLRDAAYRVGYRKLYGAALGKKELFPSGACQLQLRLWAVRVLAQASLYTDDTFQFARGARTVREALDGLPCVYPALETAEPPKHVPEAERSAWVDALFDCVEAAMAHHKHAWAKTTCDMLVKAAVDRRQNFGDEQQEVLQQWNATCKGQKVQRQQEYARQRKEQTSYERKEEEWRSAEIAKNKGGGEAGGGLDNWMAKQGNN